MENVSPGAKYVATGRGLPTYRRPFIGETEPGTTKLTKAKDGKSWEMKPWFNMV